jgi:hypothetical protein
MNESRAADLTVDFVLGKKKFEEVVMIIRKYSYRKGTQS